ncbi:MAG: CDP-alcohol phosphatidyltransferase family protein [Deltaproteobacteria bacterium]|nr:CDP-alcohol phosphatidyltransferase family protein [Deltaproteobacteria bacterium]
MTPTNAAKSQTDEWLDAWMNRPLAAILVRMLVRTPVTPNQMTFVCMLTGIAAGTMFAFGPGLPLVAGFVLAFATMVLDCTDGQLARARGVGGSTIGRILDGYGDAVVVISLHVGMYLFVLGQDVRVLGTLLTDGQKLAVFAAAGFSLQLHCALFDFYKHRFMSFTGLDPRGVETPDFYVAEMRRATSLLDKAIIAPFVLYQIGQEMFVPSGDRASANKTQPVVAALSPAQQAEYAARNAPLVRAWSFLGPTVHIAIIGLCGLATLWNHQAFLFYAFVSIVVLNAYMLMLLAWQRIANRSATVFAGAASAEARSPADAE